MVGIVSKDVADQSILELFSAHDDDMIDFLGDDSWCYTRFSESEKLEKAWAALLDGRPVGCVAYREKADGIGVVKRLYLKKEYRGKGISKELLKAAESYAKEKGCHTLFLDTRVTLEPAVSLYRSFGFQIVFQQGLYIQMEKQL